MVANVCVAPPVHGPTAPSLPPCSLTQTRPAAAAARAAAELRRPHALLPGERAWAGPHTTPRPVQVRTVPHVYGLSADRNSEQSRRRGTRRVAGGRHLPHRHRARAVLRETGRRRVCRGDLCGPTGNLRPIRPALYTGAPGQCMQGDREQQKLGEGSEARVGSACGGGRRLPTGRPAAPPAAAGGGVQNESEGGALPPDRPRERLPARHARPALGVAVQHPAAAAPGDALLGLLPAADEVRTAAGRGLQRG